MGSLAGLPSVKTAHDNDAIGTKKFRKVTKSPLNAKQLAEFKEILLLKRRQLEGDVSSGKTAAKKERAAKRAEAKEAAPKVESKKDAKRAKRKAAKKKKATEKKGGKKADE